MKNTDHSFTFVAAIVLAGVIVALASPAQPAARATPPVAHVAPHGQADTAVDESPLSADTGISE